MQVTFFAKIEHCIIPQLFSKKVGMLLSFMFQIDLLLKKHKYFWYFQKSTSINTQYSSLWDTPKMMLFTKYLIKWKCIGRISWKFWYCFNLRFSMELDIKIKEICFYLSSAPLNSKCDKHAKLGQCQLANQHCPPPAAWEFSGLDLNSSFLCQNLHIFLKVYFKPWTITFWKMKKIQCPHWPLEISE